MINYPYMAYDLNELLPSYRDLLPPVIDRFFWIRTAKYGHKKGRKNMVHRSRQLRKKHRKS